MAAVRGSLVAPPAYTPPYDHSLAAGLVRAGAEWMYVDLDVDVLDRAFAPACPASMPGGLEPADVLRAVYTLGRNPRVLGFDITEVDAAADVNDTTVRLAAAALLTFCSGVASRAAVRRAG